MIAADRQIAREAHALGFSLVGCAPLDVLPREEFLAAWLADGRAGEMRYLERRQAERLDPRRAWPWARSIVALGFPYQPPPPPRSDWRHELRGRVAAYALGRGLPRSRRRPAPPADRQPQRTHGRLRTFRPYVDTGPILEREWAMRGGLGWIGRNTLVLHRHAGSYFFLAELLTDLELDTVPLPADHCGTCTRCLSGCPTGALSRLHDGPAPLHLVPDDRAPHRHPAGAPARDRELDLRLRRLPGGVSVERRRARAGGRRRARAVPAGAARARRRRLRARFGGTAVTRTDARGLLRNVAVALGNSGNPRAVPPSSRRSPIPSRSSAATPRWALGRLGGSDARAARSSARDRGEPDADGAHGARRPRSPVEPRIRPSGCPLVVDARARRGAGPHQRRGARARRRDRCRRGCGRRRSVVTAGRACCPSTRCRRSPALTSRSVVRMRAVEAALEGADRRRPFDLVEPQEEVGDLGHHVGILHVAEQRDDHRCRRARRWSIASRKTRKYSRGTRAFSIFASRRLLVYG